MFIPEGIYNVTLWAPIDCHGMAQWLERGALPMSLPAVWFRIPLGTGFSEKYHVSQYWDIVSVLCPWARHLTLKCSLDSGGNDYLVGQRWQCV